MFNKIKQYVKAHKIISAVIAIIFILVVYFVYKKITSTAGETRYVMTRVEKGSITSSISGTGQVSASNQVDLKPKVSGNIIYIPAQNGQRVGTGALIAEIDPSDAQKSVRDAEASLQSTKLSLEKLKIQNSEENISADLEKAYNDGFSEVSDAFLDLSSTINGLKSALDQNSLSDNSATRVGKAAKEYRDKAETGYYASQKAFEENRKNYVTLDSDSPKKDIEEIIKQTTETTELLSGAIKDTLSFVDYMIDHADNPSQFSSSRSTLSSYSNTIASHLASLVGAQSNIEDNKDSTENSSLDIESAELSVTQKENALQDAKDKLADYFIRAPFAGTLANMTIKKTDQVSGSTIIATILTDQQIAEVSLNEVDVAKIKVGEKATLTFDAIPDLAISGVVEEIDSIGTVSQGVVTYNVKITFDTEDERVKPSMSVSAEIITDAKEGVLWVANSAVKSQGKQSYVEMFDVELPRPTDRLPGSISKIAPNRIPVETGLANDSQTEIISGLNEGDEIVSRTILPSATSATAPAPSLFGGGARPAGAGAANTRFQGR